MALLHRSLQIVGRQVTNITALLVVVLLVCFGLAYWLSSAIAERKDEIAAWATEKTGYPIQIGEAGLYWFDLFPKLMVTDIAVMQAEPNVEELFTAKELYIGLDLIASLQQRQLVVDSARLSGLKLGIQRSPDGTISLIGLQGKTANENLVDSEIAWLEQLKSWRDIELLSAEIQFEDLLQSQFSGLYQVNQLAFIQAKKSKLIGDVQLPNHLGQQLSFTVDAVLTADGVASWQIDELDASQLQLAALLQDQQLDDVSLLRGRADITIDTSSIVKKQWRGQVQFSDVSLANLNKPDVEPLNIDAMSGQFNWQGDAAAWQLNANPIQLTIEGDSWPQSMFNLQFSSEQGWEAESSYLRLSDATALALLSQTAPEFLTQYQPAGDIRELQLQLNNQNELLSVKMLVDEFASQPVEDIPGVTGLSLQVEWEPSYAKVLVNSRNLTIFAPSWLPEAIYFDVAEANIDWQQDEDHWQFKLSEMNIWNNDLSLRGKIGIEQQSDSTLADIDMQMLDVAVAKWLTYVPRSILDPAYLAWAEDAYTSGQIETGTLRLKGDLSEFPFKDDDSANEFEFALNVMDVGLNYGEGWPMLESINGQVLSSGNNLKILPRSGKIAGFNFVDVKADINNVYQGKPVLDLKGFLSGSTLDALGFLQASPLSPRYGEITNWVKAQGNSNIDLKLKIPLLDPYATDVEGYVSFESSQLSLETLPGMPIEDVKGKLFFNNDGVNAQAITATVFSRPVTVDVIPQAESTLVTAKGEVDVLQLAELWQGEMPGFVRGITRYQADIEIREKSMGDFETDIQVTSELTGLTIDAPEPLGKTATESRLLNIRLDQDPQQRSLIHVNYDDTLHALWLVQDPARAEITIGIADPQLPTSGIRLRGRFNELSISDWTQWQQQWLADLPATENTDNWPAVEIELAADSLQFNQWTLSDVQSKAFQRNQIWQLEIQSRQLRGDIRWPMDATLLPTLHFDFVDLQLPASTNDNAGRKKFSSDLWPSFQLNIDNLTVDGMQLGRVQAKALQQGNRWVLENATLQSAVLQANLDGVWQKSESADNSQLNLQLSSNDLAGLFMDLGYQPAVQSNQVNVTGQFSWPDEPLNLSLAELQGKLNLQVNNGQLVDVEPGAAGRIFGLMSFAAIPRRLALDFSDFFGKGFAFRQISGDFDFANGLAVTNNLTMRGESATIDVSGPINIVDRTYHQTVVVTPKVSSTLPLAGAVAGGPVGLGVGTAIYLVDRIAGRLFDRDLVDMISYRYRLTGTWDEPDLSLNRPETP
ncbi:TIGR02099 family protein [Methylophaga sp. SB9B]|uniref:YhdP family protein n=1 Tax=Methylophaga sp. SB9B TaxID=2570356 RepID=UPI0010A8842C|nr:YhdP family protein [Methylophaga sp. SB9B]THK43162.1 TIGR02099 family protein [Methylophaga sp. SB9B]